MLWFSLCVFTPSTHIYCDDMLKNIKASVNEATMYIEECTTHCKNLQDFEALYEAYHILVSGLSKLDEKYVCNPSGQSSLGTL